MPLWGATSAMAAFIGVSVVAQINGRTYPGCEVVFEAESPYGWVRVVDQPAQDIRWLMSGGSTIGAEQLSSGLSVLGYQYVVGQLPLFNAQADSALLVGVGSRDVVNTYAEFGISTDDRKR